MLTRAGPCAMTAGANPWTATPPTSWPRLSPAPRDKAPQPEFGRRNHAAPEPRIGHYAPQSWPLGGIARVGGRTPQCPSVRECIRKLPCRGRLLAAL